VSRCSAAGKPLLNASELQCTTEGAAAGGAAGVVAAAVKPVQQIVDTVKQPLQSLVDAAMPKSPEVGAVFSAYLS